MFYVKSELNSRQMEVLEDYLAMEKVMKIKTINLKSKPFMISYIISL